MKPIATASLPPSKAEIVVVGSGYGGAVAACRLARAGRQVVVLERGREKLPGQFPNDLEGFRKNLQVHTPKGSVGDPDALFDFRLGKDINVVVASGLGGGSLINGAVGMRPDERVFARWPRGIAEDAQEMSSRWFPKAEAMLGTTAAPPRAQGPRYQALKKAAVAMGGTLTPAPLNIHFVAGDSPAGIPQPACNLCGDCCSGCNTGSKNTLRMNYLPDAVKHGAKLHVGIVVSYVSWRGDGWVVHLEIEDVRREIVADVLILAAGTLGSTEILLRSQARGLQLSTTLGQRFSGNGDVLGFAYNTNTPFYSVGSGERPIDPKHPPGPTITGVISIDDPKRLQPGLRIEDGNVPAPFASLLPAALASLSRFDGFDHVRGEPAERERESLLHGGYVGATNNTLVWLVDGHDNAGGTMSLEKDRLVVRWEGVGDLPVYRRIHEVLKKGSEAIGGNFTANPGWAGDDGARLTTTHPLSGCPMGENVADGVVDHLGKVFRFPGGSWEGLYVMDGSIVPTALGANPSLTITALAERAVAALMAERSWG